MIGRFLELIYHTHIKGLSIEREYRFRLPRFGYGFQGNPIILKNYHVTFRAMTPKEYYEKYLTNQDRHWLVTPYELAQIENSTHNEVFAICYGDSEKPGPIQGAIHFIFDALRLFGYTDIKIGREFTYGNLASKSRLSSETLDFDLRSWISDDNIVYFNDEKRNRFGRFLETYTDVWDQFIIESHIEIAYRYFQRSFDEKKDEDKIFHLTIALESLFSPDDRIELRHRISLNCSFLIGNNYESREKIIYLVKQAYGIRNELAHGGFEGFDEDHFKKISKPPNICVEYLRNLVRDALVRCAILKLNKAALLAGLERDILSSSTSLHTKSVFTRDYDHRWQYSLN
ncbi:MAG: hypothetical protein IH948_06495 [Bacteroidetes bacterium]|nr:hypothetical protein [Bacteroidota bacterium]